MTLIQSHLQNLLDQERKKSKAQSMLLRVESGADGLVFSGSAGNTAPERWFPIASISKMFTAALVLKLHDTGQLDLDQTVQSTLPKYDLSDLHIVKGVSYGSTLTIRQLLHQTSGLADYFKGGVEADMIQNKDQAVDLDMVLEMTRKLRPSAAPDSGKAHYSDTNFQLLGAVIESTTSQSFATLLNEHICMPLGLKRTSTFPVDQLGADAPLPLFHKARELSLPKSLASMDPDGGLVSTPQELILFLRAFLAGQLFSSKHLDPIQEWNPVFFPLQYGGGLMRFQLPKWMTLWRQTPELIGHLGSSGSFAFYSRERDIFLAGTYNQTDLPRRPVGFMLKVLQTLQKHSAVV